MGQSASRDAPESVMNWCSEDERSSKKRLAQSGCMIVEQAYPRQTMLLFSGGHRPTDSVIMRKTA